MHLIKSGNSCDADDGEFRDSFPCGFDESTCLVRPDYGACVSRNLQVLVNLPVAESTFDVAAGGYGKMDASLVVLAGTKAGMFAKNCFFI